MNGREEQNFRERTAAMKPLNHKLIKCAGPCGRLRSAGQFAPGKTVCNKCRGK